MISRNHACVDNVVELPGCCAVSRQIESIRIRDYGTLNLADAAVGRWDSAIPPQPQPEEMPPTANIMSPQEAKGLIATKVAMPGKRIQGRVVAERAGHAMHTALVAKIMSDPSLYEIVTFDEVASRVAEAVLA